MSRIFDNNFQLPKRIIQKRFSSLDDEAEIYPYVLIVQNESYQTTGVHYYVTIESIATDGQIQSLLNSAIAVDEQTYLTELVTDRQTIKSEYVSTLATLQSYADAVNPTNAQVVAAVKFLAKTLRLLLKILAKMLF